jgi:vitamin B12 transporter
VVLFAVTPGLVAQRATSLPDIQVTATRAVAPVSRVPAAVTVITGDELRARGVNYLLDALRDVPTASVVQTGSYGAVTSLFLRGGESDYTKVLVDGVTVNSPGGAVNFAALPLDDIDRIEIMRGPAGVLYGADAMSGVIQVFTRRGGTATMAQVEGRAGTFGAQDLRARLATGVGALRASLAGSRFASDGIYPFNNRFRHSDASAVVNWQDGDRTAIDLTARYNDATGRFPTDGNGDPVDHNQRTTDRDWMLGLTAHRQTSATTRVTFEGWSHRLDTDFRDEPDDAADSTGFAFAGTRDARLTRRGATLRADWLVRPAVQLMLGLAIEREAEDQSSRTSSDFGGGSTDESAVFAANRHTRSAFVQLRASPVAALDLQLGGRVDDNSAFGGFTTGRAGVVYHLSSALRLWSAVGTGYKAPTFGELLASSPYEVGNPDLAPEQSRSVEIGVGVRTGFLTLSLTGFHQQFTDLIQYLSAQPGDPTYANLGAAQARGVEATADLRPSQRVTIRAHLTWLDTEVTDTGAVSSPGFAEGRRLLRRPTWSGGVTVLGRAGPLQWSATGRWMGERDDLSFRDFPAALTSLPSYGTVDAALEVPVVTAGRLATTLLLRAENLFDADWDQAVGFPGRGRTLLGGARFTF